MVEQYVSSSQTNSTLLPTADPATASRIQIPTTSIDRSIVLNFIDTRLAQIKSSFQQQQQTHGSNPAKTAFYLQCMDDAVVSIKRQITNLTEPIDDELLQQELDRLELRYRSCTLQTIDDDTSSSSSEQEDVDVSFDDDDILDTEAYAKVKELRAAGREIANRVIDTREETVGRALNVTERGVVELLNVHGYTNKNDEQDESIDNHSGRETVSATTNNNPSIVEPLNTALQNLTSSLTNIDSNGNLTNKLNSIRETITTIDASVDKYQRVSQGEENVISQTERAIMEATTAMNREDEEEGNRVVMGEETMNDTDGILARLLAGAL